MLEAGYRSADISGVDVRAKLRNIYFLELSDGVGAVASGQALEQHEGAVSHDFILCAGWLGEEGGY